jgi:hypothetical protein
MPRGVNVAPYRAGVESDGRATRTSEQPGRELTVLSGFIAVRLIWSSGKSGRGG